MEIIKRREYLIRFSNKGTGVPSLSKMLAEGLVGVQNISVFCFETLKNWGDYSLKI